MQPRKSKEQWYKVTRNGVEYWESETSRRNNALAAEEKLKRAEIRTKTGFQEHDIERNADRFMELLDECYQFGDPSFNPSEIYIQAGEKLGYESNYIGKLINNLVDRKLVIFEYDPNPNLHPKDSLDYWRLIFIT